LNTNFIILIYFYTLKLIIIQLIGVFEIVIVRGSPFNRTKLFYPSKFTNQSVLESGGIIKVI